MPRGRGFTGKIDDALVRSPAGRAGTRDRSPALSERSESKVRLFGLEVRAARVLSTFTERPKNVRKRKKRKVERGLRGRGAGGGLRLFCFSVGFVGKRRNYCLRELGGLRGELVPDGFPPQRSQSYAEAGDG